jgi:hypothetical protein
MKKRVLIIPIFIIAYLLIVLTNVNYNLSEFKLNLKSNLMQELTLEEMKSSNIYKAYDKINSNTKIEVIDDILGKKSRNIIGYIETWGYLYGFLSVMHNEDRILNKVVHFKTPCTSRIDEKNLYVIFKYKSIEELVNLLGEPAKLGETYDRNGKTTDFYYEWGIKTSLSKEFINEITKNYFEYVGLPVNENKRVGKFRLSVTVKANNEIIGFSIRDYEKIY